MMTLLDRLKEDFNNRSGAALLEDGDSLPYTINFSKTLH